MPVIVMPDSATAPGSASDLVLGSIEFETDPAPGVPRTRRRRKRGFFRYVILAIILGGLIGLGVLAVFRLMGPGDN
jgi:hypothetical protein